MKSLKSLSIRTKIASVILGLGIAMGVIVALFSPKQAEKLGMNVLENSTSYISRLLVENLSFGMQAIELDDGASLEKTLELLKSMTEGEGSDRTIANVWVYDQNRDFVMGLYSTSRSGTRLETISELTSEEQENVIKVLSPLYGMGGEAIGYVEVDFSMAFLKKQASASAVSGLWMAGLAILCTIVCGVLLGSSVGRTLSKNFSGLKKCSTAELEYAGETLRTIVVGMGSSAGELTSAARQLAAASQQMADGSSEQASSLEETSASLEEMSSMSRQNADNAKEANGVAATAAQEAERGNEAMKRMSAAIADIKNSSDETAKIIKVIDEIAFQTNLLALNAAVEAARAGEAGKGFAVVAEEVRNLAQRSAEAARNTSDLIEGSQKNADNGVNVAQEVSSSLQSIVGSIEKVTTLVGEIAAASIEQAQGVEQINTSVAQMDKVTQSNASNAEESAAASEELNAQVEQLKEMTYKLEEIVGAGSNGNGRSGHPNTVMATHQRPIVGATQSRFHDHLHRTGQPAHAPALTSRPAPRKSSEGSVGRRETTKLEEVIPLDEGDFKDFETALKA